MCMWFTGSYISDCYCDISSSIHIYTFYHTQLLVVGIVMYCLVRLSFPGNNPCVLLTPTKYQQWGLRVLVKHKDCFYRVFKTLAVTSWAQATKTAQCCVGRFGPAKRQNARRANLYYLQQTRPILILSTLTLNNNTPLMILAHSMSRNDYCPPKLHSYTLTTTSSKDEEDEDPAPTLLELQRRERSSAVISQPSKAEAIRSLSESETWSTDQKHKKREIKWLCRFDNRVVDIISWKSTIKSLLIYLWIVISLLILRHHSLLYLTSLSLLCLLIVNCVFVGGSFVLQAALHGQATHPFYTTLAQPTISLSNETKTAITQIIMSMLDGAIDFTARVVLVQDIGITLRACSVLWVIWAYISDTYLVLTVIVTAVFAGVPLYTQFSDTLHKMVEVFEEDGVSGVITSTFVEEKGSENDVTEKECDVIDSDVTTPTRDVISAVMFGLVIVVVVKWCNGDDVNLIFDVATFIKQSVLT
eukprot:sb/3464377/